MNMTFTLDYFISELMAFRDLFGNKKFWEKPPEKRALATRGLGIVYLNLQATPEEAKYAGQMFTATIVEYHRREFMMVMDGKSSM